MLSTIDELLDLKASRKGYKHALLASASGTILCCCCSCSTVKAL